MKKNNNENGKYWPRNITPGKPEVSPSFGRLDDFICQLPVLQGVVHTPPEDAVGVKIVGQYLAFSKDGTGYGYTKIPDSCGVTVPNYKSNYRSEEGLISKLVLQFVPLEERLQS